MEMGGEGGGERRRGLLTCVWSQGVPRKPLEPDRNRATCISHRSDENDMIHKVFGKKPPYSFTLFQSKLTGSRAFKGSTYSCCQFHLGVSPGLLEKEW